MASKDGWKLERAAFVPLCEQQEDDEAVESQPTQEKVCLTCCVLVGKVNSTHTCMHVYDACTFATFPTRMSC